MLVFFHQATAKIYAAIQVQVTFLGFAHSLISALVCMVSTEAFNGPDSTGQPACIDAAGGYNSYVSWLTDKRTDCACLLCQGTGTAQFWLLDSDMSAARHVFM